MCDFSSGFAMGTRVTVLNEILLRSNKQICV